MRLKPLAGPIVALSILLLASLFLQLHFESKKTEQEISTQQLSEFYLQDYPLQRNASMGNGPITIIAFFDPSQDITAFFSAIDDIKKEFVDTNRATLTINPIILSEEDNTLAQRFLCLQKNEPKSYQNLSKQTLQNSPLCTMNLSERIEESEFLGLHGLNARFYIGLGNDYELVEGIASPEQLQRSVRLKEITIGK